MLEPVDDFLNAYFGRRSEVVVADVFVEVLCIAKGNAPFCPKVEDCQTEAGINGDLPDPTAVKAIAMVESVWRHAEGLSQAKVVKETDVSINLVFPVLKTPEPLRWI